MPWLFKMILLILIIFPCFNLGQILEIIKSKYDLYSFFDNLDFKINKQLGAVLAIALSAIVLYSSEKKEAIQKIDNQEIVILKQKVLDYEKREFNLKLEQEQSAKQINEFMEKEKLFNHEKDELLKKEEILLQKEQMISQREQELKLKEEKIIEKENALLRKSNNNFDNLF